MCAGVSKIGGAVRRQLGEFPRQERTDVPVWLPLIRWLQWRRRTILQDNAMMMKKSLNGYNSNKNRLKNY